KYLSLYNGDTGEWAYQFRFYRHNEWLPLHINALQYGSSYSFKKTDDVIRRCLEPHQKTFYALGSRYKEKSEYALLLSSIAKERLLFLDRNKDHVETHHYLSVLEKTRYPVKNFRNTANVTETRSMDSAKSIIDLLPNNHAIVYLAELQNDTALLWHCKSSDTSPLYQLLKKKDSAQSLSFCLKKTKSKRDPEKLIIGLGCEIQKSSLHGKVYSHYKGNTAVFYSTNHYRLANKLIDGSYFVNKSTISNIALFHPSYQDKSSNLSTKALDRKIAAHKLAVSKIDKFSSAAFTDSSDTIVIVSHGPECNGVPCIDIGNEKVTIENLAAWPSKAFAGKNILLLVCTASQQLGQSGSVLSIPEMLLNKGASLVMASVDVVRENEFAKVFEDFLRVLEDKPVNYSKKWRVII
ncbi:MAG: hypothetical protein JNL74_06430, partial [Fibrobacteres bacterium]|nr:hypothetical protein [Fibrobacterota bacterium]